MESKLLSLHAVTTEAGVPGACAPKEKPPQGEARAQLEWPPLSTSSEKPRQQEDPADKNNQSIKLYAKNFHDNKTDKVFGNKFNQRGQDLHSGKKNYETLLREIKHLNKGRNAVYLLGRGPHLVRKATLPRTVGRFNAITFKLPMAFFAGMEKPIFKFT